MRIELTAVGFVHNGRTDTGDEGWGDVESEIRFEPEFAEALAGLEHWSHALVVFYMHDDPADESQPSAWQRRPRGRADMPLLGVFAQRGRMRPNPIGVTAARIVRVEAGRLTLLGLDAIDGTPVLDVKPYAPPFDRVDTAQVPAWFDELMQRYF